MDTNALRLSLISATCFLMAACSEVPDAPQPAGSSTIEVPILGKKLVMAPDVVWHDENCASRPLPYLRMERSEVTPPTVKRGNSIIYRFPYTACVPAQPGYILGRFRTAIVSNGKELSSRADETYPIDTGKWIVNTDIAVPERVNPGLYGIEATLVAEGAMIQDRMNFIVEP